jgi:hypothetical protein
MSRGSTYFGANPVLQPAQSVLCNRLVVVMTGLVYR